MMASCKMIFKAAARSGSLGAARSGPLNMRACWTGRLVVGSMPACGEPGMAKSYGDVKSQLVEADRLLRQGDADMAKKAYQDARSWADALHLEAPVRDCQGEPSMQPFAALMPRVLCETRSGLHVAIEAALLRAEEASCSAARGSGGRGAAGSEAEVTPYWETYA
eukprot:TRINITY_DN19397_c0_g1_i1.p1 TRINITY_DN19397_c0_g1~~TRINITY_DN19397_c0_g1_i1.p1  ORF type:complete len:165 (+),score=43.86 TRINITY_DN19397_c0_g1_i1:66-560(+)